VTSHETMIGPNAPGEGGQFPTSGGINIERFSVARACPREQAKIGQAILKSSRGQLALAIAGTEMSYIHCGKSLSADLDNTYLPCVERKESGESSEKDVFIRYKRIEGNWYIFEFSN
jgi:hypothetical protein